MIIRNYKGEIVKISQLEKVYNIKTKSAFLENFIKYIFKK